VTLATDSLWMDSASLPRFAKVAEDERVDVVVIGGGITGLTAAYLLTRAGKSVALIERARCAAADTGHTSAHLTMVTDRRLSELVKTFGREHAQAAWDAGLAAIQHVDSIVRDEQIACDFARIPGYLHAPRDPSRSRAQVDFAEEARLAVDLGFDAEFDRDVPLMGGPGVRFDDQARVHPRRYLAGLARALTAGGGHIHEHSAADGFSDNPLGVTVNGHTIGCDDIVLATHNPLTGVSSATSAAVFQTRLALYSTYVIGGSVPKGQVPDALFSDTGDPYDYMRLEPHRDHDLVIFGGEDHKTGQVDDPGRCFDMLNGRLRTLVPDAEITHRWSGQVIEPVDGLPYLGSNAGHQYIATGFAGNGLTFGTLGAMIAVDQIVGRRNPWTGLFDVDRSLIRRGTWDYIAENKDYLYYLIRDRFAGAQGQSLRQVRRGQGKTLDLKGQRVAAYRDDDGRTILRSATCTHLGCEVKWNPAERTWDCPCHGSRFAPTGEVLSGPAESPLPAWVPPHEP
jgi:glycine/D-amino acid oxidase-like deaminating enzyme/nitrite reductase/ring-hydroxylating ferredoxin subunit